MSPHAVFSLIVKDGAPSSQVARWACCWTAKDKRQATQTWLLRYAAVNVGVQLESWIVLRRTITITETITITITKQSCLS
jgi:hypothetical protein